MGGEAISSTVCVNRCPASRTDRRTQTERAQSKLLVAAVVFPEVPPLMAMCDREGQVVVAVPAATTALTTRAPSHGSTGPSRRWKRLWLSHSSRGWSPFVGGGKGNEDIAAAIATKATHAADTDRHGPRKTLQLMKQEPGIGPPLAEIALHKNAHLIAAGFLRQFTPVRPKSPRKLTYTAEWRSVSRARPKSSNPARPASFADHCRWPQHSASNIHPVDRRRFYGKV